MEVESEDDEVLKSVCVKKAVGHWQVTSRDSDVTYACLKVLQLACGEGLVPSDLVGLPWGCDL